MPILDIIYLENLSSSIRNNVGNYEADRRMFYPWFNTYDERRKLNFLEVFPELATAKVFITGESYAGSYIPSMAEYIVRKQLRTLDETQRCSLYPHIEQLRHV